MFVKILFFLCVVFFPNGISTYDGCTTPKQEQGECKVVKDCPPLNAVLRRRPLTESAINLLKSSHCGFEGTLPKVCCSLQSGGPKEDEELPMTTSKNANALGKISLLPNITQCGLDTEQKIVGGEKADLDEFPWMALLEYDAPTTDSCTFCCGGSLINNRYVLTAAHCIKAKNTVRKIVNVRLGEYDTKREIDCLFNGHTTECAPAAINVGVEKVIPHKDYSPYSLDQYNDVGLIRLAQEVTFSAFVRPICLPILGEHLGRSYVGRNLTVAGWGITENNTLSNVKRKLQVPVKSTADCNLRYNLAQVSVREGQLCAGGQKDQDSCRGDSGGPLMGPSVDPESGEINWYAVGVVSFGPTNCGTPGWPGIYTRVSKYANWILNNIEA